MLLLYAYGFYLISFITVLILGGMEVYKDTKTCPRSLTWGVLTGLFLATVLPIINTIVAVIMVYSQLEDFFQKVRDFMDKPIFDPKK